MPFSWIGNGRIKQALFGQEHARIRMDKYNPRLHNGKPHNKKLNYGRNEFRWRN